MGIIHVDSDGEEIVNKILCETKSRGSSENTMVVPDKNIHVLKDITI